jgi:hypothetical protein
MAPTLRDETIVVPGVSSKTALFCLDRIRTSDGVRAQNAAFDADYDAEDRVLPLDRLIAIADKSGLKLWPATFDWRALLVATATKTVLLLLRNANVVLVLGSGRDGVEEIVASDPLYQNGEPFFLPRVALEHAWGGEVLIVKPKRNRVERALAWHFSILSMCGLAAGLLLLLHAAIDVTAAGSNAPPHYENSAAVSSNRLSDGAISIEAQATAATTTADIPRNTDRRSNISDVAQANADIPRAASPEITEAASAGEAQKTEQPLIGLHQGSGVPTVEATIDAQEASPAVEESGAKSAESPAGEVPEAPMAATPITQTDAASARATRLSLSTDEVAALLARGDFLIAKGDVASARLFYERAAEAGQGQAALRLGESYDPAFLARVHLSGVRGDALAAARWYRRARELGTSEAATLLETLPPEKDQRLP